MGKKNKMPPVKKTSNMAFGLIVLVFSILLWITTGFYYLNDNQFGLIIQNGRIVQTVKGIKVGFTAPYPFGGVEIVDANNSDLIDVSSMSSGAFSVLSQNLEQVVVDAKFTYQIYNPELVFKTILQRQDTLDNFATWKMQASIHDYFRQKETKDILGANLTVAANEIKNEINQKLAPYGIKVTKINIYSLQTPVMINEDAKSSAPVIKIPAKIPAEATNLIAQANMYSQNLLIDTQVNINQFNQMLPQYRQNHNGIVTQMYYDTLSAIPVLKKDNYPLLSLPLSQLLQDNQTTVETTAPAPAAENIRERHFGRDVDRSRFGDDSDE